MSIRVCYKHDLADTIGWDNAVAVEKGNILRFEDGRWNPADECFFTEAQCRSYHRLPMKGVRRKFLKIADRLDKIAEELRTT